MPVVHSTGVPYVGLVMRVATGLQNVVTAAWQTRTGVDHLASVYEAVQERGLGEDIVVQTPYGDSGRQVVLEV